jgi:hypothetical protein
MIKEDMLNITEASVLCGINALWINEWLNVGVAGASLCYLGYKTYLLHRNKDKK